MQRLKIKKPQRGLPFPVFLAIYAGVCAVIVTGALLTLWNFLGQYETSLPANLVKQLTSCLEDGDYSALVESDGFVADRFTSAGQFGDFWQKQLGGKQIAYSQAQDKNVYLLSAGGESFATVTLAETGEVTGFGFAQWRLERVEPHFEAIAGFTVRAPAGAQVAVNGIPLGQEELDGPPEDAAPYQGLPEGMSPPQVLTYRIPRLFETPAITAVLEGSGGCAVTMAKDGRSAVISAVPTEEWKAQLDPLARQIAQVYARFTSKDAAFSDLRGYLLGGTDFYQKMSTFDNHWYIPHDSNGFSEMKTDNFVFFSPDHAACDITFLYQVIKGSKTHEYPAAYTLYFVRRGDGWSVASMNVL